METISQRVTQCPQRHYSISNSVNWAFPTMFRSQCSVVYSSWPQKLIALWDESPLSNFWKSEHCNLALEVGARKKTSTNETHIRWLLHTACRATFAAKPKITARLCEMRRGCSIAEIKFNWITLSPPSFCGSAREQRQIWCDHQGQLPTYKTNHKASEWREWELWVVADTRTHP